MNIGILTFHYACNYGAVLQCFALQKYLMSQGHEVTVIDYKPKAVASGYKWLDIRRFWGTTPCRFYNKTKVELKVISKRKRRYDAFDAFVSRYLDLSVRIRNVKDMELHAQKYDMIIIGSDQVWNTKITGGFDKIYWGMFKHGESPLLISYATSMENSFDQSKRSVIADHLKKFNTVSVREKSLKNLLEPCADDKKISVVADPTMLLDASDWERLLPSDHLTEEPYLLFYQVRHSERAFNIASRIAKEKGLRIICLSARPELVNSPEVSCASPEDFVSLFKNASFVVTTSFHGTSFSIIFRKEFLCIDTNDGRNSRQTDLLEKVGLADRMVSADSEESIPDIDWESISSRIDEYIVESKNYLLSCGI